MNPTTHIHPAGFFHTDTTAPRANSWLFTHDHKRIGFLYLFSVTVFACFGLLAAATMRVEMLTPEGDVISGSGFGKLFSLHGIMMFYFFALPAIPAILGNMLLPLMLGARNVAFPRLNLVAWYLFSLGGVLILLVVMLGGMETGWSMFAAYSGAPAPGKLALTAAGLLLASISCVLTALNFIASLHTLRGKDVSWSKVSVFAWSLYVASGMVLLATPLLITTLAILLIEQIFTLGIFNPWQGGDPELLRRLFGFYYTPAQYMILLPVLGVTGEIISCFSRRGIVGKRVVVYAFLAMAVLSFLGGGQQLLAGSASVLSGMVASLFSIVMVVPFMVVLGHWIATLYKARTVMEVPMIYALGGVIMLTVGVCSGLALSALPLGRYLQGTYFEVAHFHFLMAGGMLLAFLGAVHYWWPILTGRRYPETAARGLGLLCLLGVVLTFVPMFLLGSLGLPRRHYAYPEQFQVHEVMISAGASLLLVALLAVGVMMVWSLVNGKRCASNPWGSTGLEW